MAWDDATFSHQGTDEDQLDLFTTSRCPLVKRNMEDFFFLFLFCLVLTYQWYCYIIIFVLLLERQSWLISELFFSNILNLKESEPLLNPKLFIFDPETNGFWASSFQKIPWMTVLVVNLVWYSFNLFPLGIHANQLKLLLVCGVAFQLALYWGSKHVHKIPGDHHLFLGVMIGFATLYRILRWELLWRDSKIGTLMGSEGPRSVLEVAATPPGWRVMKGHEWPFWWLLDIPTSPVRLAFSHLGHMIVVIGINQASAHSIFTTTKCHLGVMPISSSLIPTATPATHITEFSCREIPYFSWCMVCMVMVSGIFPHFSAFFPKVITQNPHPKPRTRLVDAEDGSSVRIRTQGARGEAPRWMIWGARHFGKSPDTRPGKLTVRYWKMAQSK